jgi:hypothetical protein
MSKLAELWPFPREREDVEASTCVGTPTSTASFPHWDSHQRLNIQVESIGMIRATAHPILDSR